MSHETSPSLEPDEQARALAEFLARHVKPYEPETDDYDRPPFAADIKEGKNDPIYNAHSYHTKVPPRSIIPYILHYTEPDDLVLDLFCGSGMTGVAAQMCDKPPSDLLDQFPELKDRVGPRACILNDLSPAACHIAHNYCIPNDAESLERELERIKSEVRSEFDWLYGTEHYEPAVGLYSIERPEVLARLKCVASGNLTPAAKMIREVTGEPTWALVNRDEVEKRLGYPVSQLKFRDSDKGTNGPLKYAQTQRGGDATKGKKETSDLDLAQIETWIVIPATTQYTIWSDVHRCQGMITIEEPTGKTSTRGKNIGKPMVRKKRVARGCGEPIVLWKAAVDRVTGKVQSSFACPVCGTQWKKTEVPRVGDQPALCRYEFAGLRESGGEIKSSVVHCERDTSALELARLSEIAAKSIPYWFPKVELDTQGPQYRRNALSRREVFSVADFYTKRNLWAQARLWKEFGESDHRSALRFLFTAITNGMTKRSGYIPGETARAKPLIKGSLYVPSFPVEWNALPALNVRLRQLRDSFREWRPSVERTFVMLGHAGHLPILSDSVDYVFTDPPFGSNIYYSELGVVWESWLGSLMDRGLEAVVHRKNDGGYKRLPDYEALMTAAFSEMARVLKPGRFATVEFNNSDGAVFESIKRAIRNAGFEIKNMVLLDKVQKTFKGLKGAEGFEDVVDKDVLFNLCKPAFVRTEARRDVHDLEQQIADAIRQHLRTLPDRIKADATKYNDEHRTTATINSMLMNTLIPRGIGVERLNLPFIENVCARYFRKVEQRWYLRGEAVGNNADESRLFEEEVQVVDEVTAIEWLRQKLHSAPALIGELKPRWMRATGLLPATVSETLVLEDLLVENFWRDQDTNRWREPTDEERERMNDDRSIRVLHDAERFVAGTLRRPSTDQERCDWIDVLFKVCRQVEDGDSQSTPALRGFDCSEAYRIITRLFQTILEEKVPQKVFSRTQKQAAAASKRIMHEVRDEELQRAAEAAKRKGPTLFDLEDVT